MSSSVRSGKRQKSLSPEKRGRARGDSPLPERPAAIVVEEEDVEDSDDGDETERELHHERINVPLSLESPANERQEDLRYYLASNEWNTRYIEQVNMIDLDAYNYLCYVLDAGQGAEDQPGLATNNLPGILKKLRTDLLKHPHLFDLTLRPEIFSSETNIRVQIAVGVLALEELESLEAEYESAGSVEAEYRIMKRTAVAFLRIANYISSDALTDEEKASLLFAELFSKIKAFRFLAELCAGNFIDGQYVKWTETKGRKEMKNYLHMTIHEAQGFPPGVGSVLNNELEGKQLELEDVVANIPEFRFNFEATREVRDRLLYSMGDIFHAANSQRLPVYLPAYHSSVNTSLRTRQLSKLRVLKLRDSQASRTAINDILGIRVSIPDVNFNNNNGVVRDETRKSKRMEWTEEETITLEEGIRHCNTSWSDIKKRYPTILANRTPVNLKDKARSIRRQLERAGEPLGVFAYVNP